MTEFSPGGSISPHGAFLFVTAEEEVGIVVMQWKKQPLPHLS